MTAKHKQDEGRPGTRVITIVPLLLSAVVTSTVFAAGPMPFSAMDKDGSGTVSEQEFNEFRAARMGSRAAEGYPMRNIANAPVFSDFDADKDGYISEQEFSDFRAARMQGRMGDGQAMHGMANTPSNVEHDDGALQQDLSAETGNKAQSCDPKLAQSVGGAKMPDFESFDSDGDGYISEAELNAFRAKRLAELAEQGVTPPGVAHAPVFSELDSDGDQRLSHEELVQARAKHMQQMQHGGSAVAPASAH